MKRTLLLLLTLLMLSGCARRGDFAATAPVPASPPPADIATRYLAYQHSVHVDTDEQKVPVVFEAAQAACREAAAELCVILESRINTGRQASASLKFRAKPAGIRKLVDTLGMQGEITDRSTSAEDLASPIEDAARKLAMLNDYRAKLEALRGRANNDIDALIKVNKELPQVQSELEAMAGKHAHLMQRVETEILNVSIGSVQERSFWRPTALALSDFAANLSQGASIAITGIAFLIPWVVILVMLAWIGRTLWRRWRRARTRP